MFDVFFFLALFYLFVILHLFCIVIIIIIVVVVVLEIGTLKQNPFIQSIKQVKRVGEQVVVER